MAPDPGRIVRTVAATLIAAYLSALRMERSFLELRVRSGRLPCVGLDQKHSSAGGRSLRQRPDQQFRLKANRGKRLRGTGPEDVGIAALAGCAVRCRRD